MGVQSPSNMHHYRGIEGLGGWLAILQILLYGSLFSLLLQLLISYSAMNGDAWNVLALETSEHFVAAWRNAVTFEVGSSLFQIGLIVYVLFMFYGKKRLLPKLMIVYFPIVFLLNLADYYLLHQAEAALALVELPEALSVRSTGTDKVFASRALFRSFAGCLIWIPYFLKSERVENTFVR